MWKRLLGPVLAVLFVIVTASPAAAQGAGGDDGVLVRVNGDVAVADGEIHGVVVVVDGDLQFAGAADTIVVVNGSADLVGATVDTLVVVSGTADLGPGTVVSGDVRLVDSTLTQDPTATVEGSVREGFGSEFVVGFWIAGVLFMIGWAVLVLLAGQALAAVAPRLAREAGRAISTDLGPTIAAGLALWIAVPIVGAVLFATIIGIPTALAIWLMLLPAVGFVGFLVAGVRVGELITARDGGVGHPYLAALLGLLILIVAGAIPLVGPLVVVVAGFLGSGALALLALRAVRSQPAEVEEAPVPPVAAAGPSDSASAADTGP